MRTRSAALAAILSIAAAEAGAAPVLSEIYYDAVGSDDGVGFVEIFGEPGTGLDGLTIEGINGSGGVVTHSLALTGTIGASGVFVVADQVSGGTGSLVSGADLVLDFDLQNGPDSVVLRDANGVLDAVGYGVFGAGEVFAGEGAPAPDPAAGSAIARLFADVDTNDNAADWFAAAPSPGSVPRQAVAEPSLVALLAAGAAALRRRRR
jgi:MYXO-CTERM domain-containing protein